MCFDGLIGDCFAQDAWVLQFGQLIYKTKIASMKPSAKHKPSIRERGHPYNFCVKMEPQYTQTNDQLQTDQMRVEKRSQQLEEQPETSYFIKREAGDTSETFHNAMQEKCEQGAKREMAKKSLQLRSKEKREKATKKLASRRFSKRILVSHERIEHQLGSKREQTKLEPQIQNSHLDAVKIESKNPLNEFNQLSADNYSSIRQILLLKLDHRGQEFYCGWCTYNSNNPAAYFKHNAISHSLQIHQASSHIILRCYSTRSQLLYISLRTPWIHEERKYSCPCQTQLLFSMKGLVDHMMAIHYGISPVYCLSRLPLIRQEPFLKKELEMLQHIRDITFDCQKHKAVQFYCGNCGKTYVLGGKYKIHMQRIHDGFIGALSSHIIMRTQYRQDIYISPRIGWHHERTIYFCPCRGIHDCMSMQELIKHILVQHRGISPVYQTNKLLDWRGPQRQKHVKRIKNGNDQDTGSKWQDPMHLLIKKGVQDHRHIKFQCRQCQFETNHPKKYSNHIQKVHGGCIPSNSSHIIFHFAPNCSQIRRKLYVCPDIQWKVPESANYYCPCLPENRVNMENLIKHIMQEHIGISPKYNFEDYDPSGARYTKMETKMEHSALDTQPSIKLQ